MPPRTSAPRRRTTSHAASSPHSTPVTMTHQTRESIAHHGSSITILWVLMVCMSIAVWMVLLVTMLRLDQLEATLADSLRQQVDSQQVTRPITDTLATLVAKDSTSTTSLSLNGSVSPSGALDRGSLSADGTKYAGYDSIVKGKIGIGVEIPATKQVKHIVLFDTRSQSTGKGTPFEGMMSARWKDASTIEYDILVRKNGEWKKEVQSTKIFF